MSENNFGWATPETYLFWLIVENDRDFNSKQIIEEFQAEPATQTESGIWSRDEYVLFSLETYLKKWIENQIDDVEDETPGLVICLARSAMYRIHFKEVAQALIERNIPCKSE